jgi:hypothetical protein
VRAGTRRRAPRQRHRVPGRMRPQPAGCPASRQRRIPQPASRLSGCSGPAAWLRTPPARRA